MAETDIGGTEMKYTETATRTEERGFLPALLSSKEAARILGVSERTVTRMCEQGKLKAVKVMSLWRINRDALLDFAGLE